MSALKPCPGCGDDNPIIWYNEDAVMIQCNHGDCGWRVYTQNELLKGIPEDEYYTQDHGTFSIDTPGLQPAIDRWNKRTDS